jgi:pimeloyl-ACP methyl ester carboxylesterase
MSSPSAAPVERALPLRGLLFSAIEWGEPVGTPTVFLHGFLDHAGSWSRVASRLSGWRVALDQRGHGRSAWIGPGESYHFPEYLADLDALVDLLGRPVRLVGHSMGGTVASLYAGARPDAVERLVVVDGLGLADGGASARDRMIQFLDGIRAVRDARPMPSVAHAAARLRTAWPGLDEEFATALAARGTRAVPGGFAWSYDPRHRVRAAMPYRQDQHLRFLAEIRCPVLSVRAERSIFATEDVARLETGIAGLRVVTLAGTGHMVQLDAPEALASVIASFFADSSVL